jgi:hypothetical protein
MKTDAPRRGRPPGSKTRKTRKTRKVRRGGLKLAAGKVPAFLLATTGEKVKGITTYAVVRQKVLALVKKGVTSDDIALYQRKRIKVEVHQNVKF